MLMQEALRQAGGTEGAIQQQPTRLHAFCHLIDVVKVRTFDLSHFLRNLNTHRQTTQGQQGGSVGPSLYVGVRAVRVSAKLQHHNSTILLYRTLSYTYRTTVVWCTVYSKELSLKNRLLRICRHFGRRFLR